MNCIQDCETVLCFSYNNEATNKETPRGKGAWEEGREGSNCHIISCRHNKQNLGPRRNSFHDSSCHFNLYSFIYKYTHACMHAYIHAYIHTYIHTYIHACILRPKKRTRILDNVIKLSNWSDLSDQRKTKTIIACGAPTKFGPPNAFSKLSIHKTSHSYLNNFVASILWSSFLDINTSSLQLPSFCPNRRVSVSSCRVSVVLP